MSQKVIRFDFRDPRRRSGIKSAVAATGRSCTNFTREELKAWAKIAPSTTASTWRPLVLTLIIHGALVLGLESFKKPLVINTDGGGGSARVTIVEGSSSGASDEGTPEPQPFPNKPVDAPVITGPSTSAAGSLPRASTTPSSPASPETVSPSTRTKASSGRLRVPAQEPLVDNANRDEEVAESPSAQASAPTQTPEESSKRPGVGFSKDLEDLLPNSNSEYVATQRRIGSIYGKGAVGGDLADEAPSPTGYKPPDRGEVKVTRYDYAAYFLSLDRRFTEAWGGTRTLPRGSYFVGTVGEFIEYDIAINRDGSLSKIINVSQKEQPGRDFSAVDGLVESVFANVFPLNPVPDRIREDPLILRKRIQFTGYRLFFY